MTADRHVRQTRSPRPRRRETRETARARLERWTWSRLYSDLSHFFQVSTHAHGPGRHSKIERERSSRASKVQLLTLVHSALERPSLPLGVERPLERLHAARQLLEARVVDDQDAVEVVELVLEGLGLGLGLGLLG